MRVLDLFSGIGGFSLGLQMAGGFRTVQFCEIDPWCRAVLAKNFPGVPRHDDIRTLEPAAGCADIVVGGFPCQPFSHAGKRRGKADDRDLWPEMARVIDAVRPAWVIGENVAGFVQMELDRSLADLESLGYACQAFVIPACAVDAPHRRDRVWIVGYTDRHGKPAVPVDAEMAGMRAVADAERDGGEHRGRTRNVAGQTGKGEGAGPEWERHGNAACHSGAVVSDAERQRLERQQQGRSAARPVDRSGHGGDPCRWEAEPRVGRVADGIPRRMDRLRGLGNAVVPQVVAEIGRAIQAVTYGRV